MKYEVFPNAYFDALTIDSELFANLKIQNALPKRKNMTEDIV